MKEDILERGRKAFLERVLDMARRTLGPEKLIKDLPPCTRYSPADIERYVNEEMPETNMLTFREHSQVCKACAVQLFQETQSKIRMQEEAEDKYLFQATMDHLDRIDRERARATSLPEKPMKPNILHIFIDTVGSAFFPVMTSGEQLMPKTAAMMRTQEPRDYGESGPGIQIIKDFSQPGVSVQVNLIDKGKEKAGLEVSVFDKEEEVFVAGVAVNLIRNTTIEQTSITDKSGRVFFIIQTPAEHDIDPCMKYQIDLYRRDEQICQVILYIKKDRSETDNLNDALRILSKTPIDKTPDDLSVVGEITLNMEQGTIALHREGMTLSSNLALKEFLHSTVDRTRDELLTDEDRGLYSFNLEHQYMLEGMLVRLYLTFVSGSLIRVGIRNVSKYYVREIFTWDTEIERKKSHDEWIADHIGPTHQRPWGKILSYYDEAIWGAVIFILY